MKIAAVANAINRANRQCSKLEKKIKHIIVHTGQHYDRKMSKGFFKDLNIPHPDVNLEVGSGSHARQTAEIMKRFEPVLLEQQPDFLMVVGDVNSTVACTLVASKIEYLNNDHRRRPIIVHVEAGLRSFDRDMPEEINRVLTDSISDVLFTTEEQCFTHLQNEGVSKDKVFFIGNVMIDTLMQHVKQAASSRIKEELDLTGSYALMTLHRPSNVDRKETLQPLVDCINEIAGREHIVFPVHPRTLSKLKEFALLDSLEKNTNITLVEPLGYFDFLNLVKDASVVITDSGGIQEETTVLQIPCVTLRENTERPVTVDIGTNYLVGVDPEKIKITILDILAGKGKRGTIPKLWDGNAGDRIIAHLSNV